MSILMKSIHWPMVLLIFGLAVLVIVSLVFPHLQFVITLAVAKGFAALGVALLLRGGLISLGHAMYFAIGAYTTAFLTSRAGVSDLLILVSISVLVSCVAGLVFGSFLVRYRAIFFAMLNLAISMVLYSLTSKLYGLTGGTDGLGVAVPTVLGWSPDKAKFDRFLFYAAVGLMLLLGWLIERYLQSPLGKALSAIHTNEVRLEYLGVSSWSTLLFAYGVSAGIAGLGGAIAAMAIGHVLPEYAFWTESGHLVLTAVLGGTGSVAGAFIGSVFLEILHSVAVGITADAWNLIIGSTLIIVIFFLPRGIYGLIEKIHFRGGR
jgi:ABC-type branched-subunit amino acid transport system permease subunit